jgi:hypothetical protein
VPSVARSEDSKGSFDSDFGTNGIQPASSRRHGVALHVEKGNAQVSEHSHNAIELGVGSPVPINAIARWIVHVFARGKVGSEDCDGAYALAPRVCCAVELRNNGLNCRGVRDVARIVEQQVHRAVCWSVVLQCAWEVGVVPLAE